MSWGDLGAAIALLLVLEGILPFLSPAGFRQALQHALETPDRTLRIFGLTSMTAGLVLLYWVRS